MTCPARPSGATIIATLTIAILMAPNLTAVPPQLPAGQARETREMFRGRAAEKGEVLVAFRRSPDLARLRAEIDSDGDAVIGSGRLWHARSRSRNVASLIAYLQTRSDVLYAEPNYIVYADNLPERSAIPGALGSAECRADDQWRARYSGRRYQSGRRVGWRAGIAQHRSRRRRHRDRLHASGPGRERLVGPCQLQRDDWRADDHLRRRDARIQRAQQDLRSLRRSLPWHARLGHHRRGR